jgi:autotransporter-associated beta strand protein
MKLRATNPFRSHLFTLAALLSASFVHAASPIWSGTTSNLWSVGGIGGNWTDAATPIAGDTLNFAGTTNVSTNNDLTADTDFAAINFTNTGAGAGAFTLAGNRITLGGNITTTATALGSGGPLTVTDTISLDMVLNGNRTITANSAGSGATGMNHNLTISGIISETGGARTLTKAGTGTLTLSGPNTYTGTTAISSGPLAISNNTALGTTAGNTTIVATGATASPQLAISGNINSAENISLTGNTEQNQFNSAILNNSGVNTLSGNITLPSPAGAIRITSGGGELTFAGTITQTGTTRTLVFQAGSGTAITVNNAIANNNANLNILGFASGSASNGVTLKGGTANNSATNVQENGLLKLGINDALKTTASLSLGTNSNFLGNGGFDFGKFDLAGFNQTVGSLNGVKNTGNTIGADSNRIVTNSAASGSSTLTVGNGNTSGTLNGVILDGPTAAVALTKIGTGTQTLVGNSNYSGVTTISGGIIAISHANALGSTAGNTTIATTGSTGVLSLSGGINSPENITITGATENAGFGSAILNTSGNNTLSGNIIRSSTTGGVRFGSNSGSLTFSGTLSQTTSTNQLTFITSGTGSIIVNNAIANNGGALFIYGSGAGVTVKGVSGSGIGGSQISQSGTLILGVTDALNTIANLDVGVSGADVGTFNLAGFNQTVNVLNAASGGDANHKVTNTLTNTTSTLTVGNNNGTGTFNGVIVDGVAANAKVAITKVGIGTQTLTGANTYSGNTTVSGGTLALANPNANNQTSTVTIAAASAKLQLTFAAITPDTVEKLFIGATQQVIGEYGHTNSGATNGGAGVGTMDAYFAAGTGKLNVTTGPGGGAPEIAIGQGGDITNGGTKGFGTVTTGSNTSLIFTITNSGTAALNLNGSPLVNVTGTNAADFTVTALPTTPVTSGGGTTTFTVQFAPGASGARNAVLTIANDDSDESTFTIIVSGTGQTPYEAWAGGVLFDADANVDGVNNGLAFLLGAANPNDSAVSLLPTATHNSGNLILTFKCLNAAKRGSASLNVQYSKDLGITDLWTGHFGDSAVVPGTAPTTVTVGGVDFVSSVFDADRNNMQATIPASEAAPGTKLFGRLKATGP